MFKTLSLAGAALALSVGALAPTAADAQRYSRYDQAYGAAYNDGYNRDAYRGYDQRGYDQRSYDQRGYDRRSYDRRGCNSGAGGTIIGAIAGGLLGRTIDTRGDRTLGTVLGAGAGALAGNAVGRSNNPGYCRR